MGKKKPLKKLPSPTKVSKRKATAKDTSRPTPSVNSVKSGTRSTQTEKPSPVQKGKPLPPDTGKLNRARKKAAFKAHEATTSQPVDSRPFRDQLRDLVSNLIVPVGLLPTLLCDPTQLPDRPRDPHCRLTWLIDNDLYARMMSVIMSGASPKNAMTLFGVYRDTFLTWRSMGLNDIQAKQDTYYSRFIQDFNIACMIPTIDAETRIAAKDPLQWLQIGPGRSYNWVESGTAPWQQVNEKIQQNEPPDPSISLVSEPSDVVEDNPLLLEAPVASDLPEALRVLQEVGLGHKITEALNGGHDDNSASNGFSQTNGNK